MANHLHHILLGMRHDGEWEVLGEVASDLMVTPSLLFRKALLPKSTKYFDEYYYEHVVIARRWGIKETQRIDTLGFFEKAGSVELVVQAGEYAVPLPHHTFYYQVCELFKIDPTS